MKITALTCTYQRPEAFELCKKWMARQTRQPDQWLILDGPEPMREKVVQAIEKNLIEGDAVVFWEDDDFYKATWIEWCEKYLSKYEIVGQGLALYYHVGRRWWSCCGNTRHASLCQTAIQRSMLKPLAILIKAFDNQFFDTRLWRLERTRYLHLPTTEPERLVIGMKGLSGTVGYSHEHKTVIPPKVNLDPALVKLWSLMAKDATNYSKFYLK